MQYFCKSLILKQTNIQCYFPSHSSWKKCFEFLLLDRYHFRTLFANIRTKTETFAEVLWGGGEIRLHFPAICLVSKTAGKGSNHTMSTHTEIRPFWCLPHQKRLGHTDQGVPWNKIISLDHLAHSFNNAGKSPSSSVEHLALTTVLTLIFPNLFDLYSPQANIRVYLQQFNNETLTYKATNFIFQIKTNIYYWRATHIFYLIDYQWIQK